MKLVEILARKLKEWPSEATHAVQDGRGKNRAKIWMLTGDSKNTICNQGEWDLGRGVWICGSSLRTGTLATDHATAIVTREMWEAERAKLKTPKANGNGWIRHRGGKCPVEAGTLVDVRLRCKHEEIGVIADDPQWVHYNHPEDVMRYRPHKPAEQPDEHDLTQAPKPEVERKCEGRNCEMPGAENHSKECLLDAAIDQGWAGPLEWRDRIRELDTQRAEIESTYQRKVSEITQERESWVQKLAGEGLALVEVVVQPVEEWPEGAPDRKSAPEWATHIGRDARGFHWFDHSPEKFDSECFLKGCLGDAGYRNGRWEEAVKMENNLPLWFAAI